MKSAVFIVSALLVVSCQALTPIGPGGPGDPYGPYGPGGPGGPFGPGGPDDGPIVPGLIHKFQRPFDPIRHICGSGCDIWCRNRNVVDSLGCHTCRCKPNNCLKARSCFFCPYGRTYFTGSDGCRTCKCKPAPEPVDICPRFECFRKCSYGYNTDSRGCKLCSCKSGATCTYNGKTYSNGQSFKKDCNNCFCLNGKTLCTERACWGSCRDGGRVYQNGDSYKKDCNSCFCRNGRSLCTSKACLALKN